MTIIADTRPEFVPGHVLGHEDLQLLMEYLRDAERRLRLAHRTAGIVAGLRLRPVTDVIGQTAWVLGPGIAVDGYGRMILSLETIEIDPADLAGLPSGPTEVWIGYSEEPRRGYRKGFEVCDLDAFSRVDEGVELFFGRRDALIQRRDGIDVDGLEIADAREVLGALGDPARPTVCDGSVGYQVFPDPAERRRWLVPLGRVGWNGATLVALDPLLEQPQSSRAERRFSGVVTEEVLATEGLLRLARRETRAPLPGETVDAVCAERRLRPSDFVVDPLDPAGFVPEDLVWVEGHLRALGELRLWGTELSFRNADGSQTSSSGQFVPLGFRRSPGDGLTSATQDIEMTLGEASQTDAENRLAVGRRAPDGSLTITAALTGLGRLGLGTGDPGRYLPAANSLVIEGDAEAGVTIRASGAGAIHFAQGDAATAQTRGRILYDQGMDAMVFRTADEDRLWLDSGGRLGLGLADPGGASSFADDFVILREGSAGISILNGATAADAVSNDWTGRINFGRGTGGSDTGAGAIVYLHGSDDMQVRTASTTRVTIDRDGNVGIGETDPATRLHIDGGAPLSSLASSAGSLTVGSTGGDHLKLGEAEIQALRGSGQFDALQIQPLGGGLRVHGQLAFDQRVAISEAGELGLGTDSPGARLEVRGRIRMGGTGSQFALAGLAGELVVRGTVSGAGTTLAGSGFMPSRTAAGRYRISFITPFSGRPTVTVTVEEDIDFGDNLLTVSDVSQTGFTVRIVDVGEFIGQGGTDAPASADEDAPFNFIAIGPSQLLEP